MEGTTWYQLADMEIAATPRISKIEAVVSHTAYRGAVISTFAFCCVRSKSLRLLYGSRHRPLFTDISRHALTWASIDISRVSECDMNSTTTIAHQIYRNGFEYYKMGYASAQAVVLMVIIFAITLINMRFGGGDENDLG